jgi:hypothetical protein
MKTAWRLMTHHEEEDKEPALRWAVANRRLAIGWGLVGDIRTLGRPTALQISQALQQAYPHAEPVTWRQGGESLYDFYYRMKKGDLVIVSTGKGRLEVVMEVMGDYEYRDHPAAFSGSYRHQRLARIADVDPGALWTLTGGVLLPEQVNHQTLVQFSTPIDEERLANLEFHIRVNFH